MDWYHYCSTCIFFVQVVDNLGAEYYCMDLQGQVIINIITVKPLLRDPLLNSHPLWSGHQSNSRSLFSIIIYCEIFDLYWAVTLPLVPEVIFLLPNSW